MLWIGQKKYKSYFRKISINIEPDDIKIKKQQNTIIKQ